MKRLLLPGIGAALLAGAPTVGVAEPHSGVDTHLYRPAFDPNGIYSVEGGAILPKHDFSLKMGVGFGQKPFDLAVPGIDGGSPSAALDYTLGMHMTLSFAVTAKLQIGLDTGLYRTATGDAYGKRGRYYSSGSTPSTGLIALRPLSNIDPSGGFEAQGLAGPFDVRLSAKYQVMTGPSFNVAILGISHVPFGDEEMFLGDSSFVFEPRLAIDWKLNRTGSTRLSLNAGARFRERTVLESYDPLAANSMVQPVFDLGSEALAGGGIVVELMPQLTVGAETMWFVPLPAALSFGDCRLHDGRRCSRLDDGDYFGDASYGDAAGYAMGGLNYRATPDLLISLSGGAGLAGVRADDFRVLSGVTWAPTPAGTRVIGRGDRDGDGIPDHLDLCPDEPEDRDGFQDDDGCPELDNDGDGIIDASDACPNEPEDRDGFQDEDGCPDRDNDGDGIADVVDRCPNEPEDFDGFEDDDGCPDEDNDGDGIPDDKDQCPNEPETVNGVDDFDGCPDERLVAGPQLSVDRIDMQGTKIEFSNRNSSDLTSGSKQLLDQIAQIIVDSKVEIRVEVHVPLSTTSKNRTIINRQKRRDQQLAGKRADAVVAYLKAAVVKRASNNEERDLANRISGVGLGSDVPIVENNPSDALNERVDFIRVR